jgi:hypothetical protein
MQNSQVEALKIRWYKQAVAGNPIIGEDKALFDSLPSHIQAELKKAYLFGVNDEQETWLKPATKVTPKVMQ